MHQKDVTDNEIRIVMEPVYETIREFLVPRQPPEQKAEVKQKDKKTAQIFCSKIEEEFLESIYENPNLSTTGRTFQLGLNASKMNELKKRLKKKGLITQFNINIGKNVTMLELTKDGYSAIGKRQKYKIPENVSKTHFWWARTICDYYNKKGIKAEIEKAMNGKRADVGIIYNGMYIAIEIELSIKNAISNISEDLKVGFKKVYSCCKNSLVAKEIKRQLETYKGYEDIKDRVSIRLLTDFEFVKDIRKGKI